MKSEASLSHIASAGTLCVFPEFKDARGVVIEQGDWVEYRSGAGNVKRTGPIESYTSSGFLEIRSDSNRLIQRRPGVVVKC